MIRTILLSLLLSTAALAADISGKWVFTVQTDAGGGSPTFVFKQAGEKLTGTYTGQFGTADVTGTVKGDEIQFSIDIDAGGQKATIVYKGKIQSDGKKAAGSVELAGFGSGTWTGEKQS
jgi:hypothetical protein